MGVDLPKPRVHLFVDRLFCVRSFRGFTNSGISRFTFLGKRDKVLFRDPAMAVLAASK